MKTKKIMILIIAILVIGILALIYYDELEKTKAFKYFKKFLNDES